METIQFDWKNEKQKVLVMELLKALQVKFCVITEDGKHQLYGEGFKKSILNGKAAYESGDRTQFVTIKREDIFQKINKKIR